MRSRNVFLPVAAMVISQPAHATVYMTVEQAEALIFAGATFSQDFPKLSREQARVIEKASGVHVADLELRTRRASTGGWLIVDQVIGKHEFIPFAVSIDAAGAIKNVEIFEYRRAYGEESETPNGGLNSVA